MLSDAVTITKMKNGWNTLAKLWTLTAASHPHLLPRPPQFPSSPHPAALNMSSSHSLPSFRLLCPLTPRRPCVLMEGRALKDLWTWPLAVPLYLQTRHHLLAPSRPHPFPIISSSSSSPQSASSLPHRAHPPSPRDPAACIPNCTMPTASLPPHLAHLYQHGRTNRTIPRRIRRFPSLPMWGWQAATTPWWRTVVMAAPTQAARRVRVHVWGSWSASTVLTRRVGVRSYHVPVLTLG